MHNKEVERLERELGERDDLLAFVAHELRAPLHAMGLLIAAARVSAQAAGAAQAADRIRKAEKAINQYNERASALLELAKSSSTAFYSRAQKFQLDALLKRTVEEFAEEAAQKGVQLIYECPDGICLAETDPNALEHVVGNLIANTLKHASASILTVALTVTPDHRAEISVTDNGHGIPVEQQRRIFEKFERGKNAARGTGSGLGLWIVNKLVHAIDGTITLESSPTSGSRFAIQFPLSVSLLAKT